MLFFNLEWCTVTGRSQGSSLRKHDEIATSLECQALCEAETGCLSYEYQENKECWLLDRKYEGNFQYEGQSKVANKGEVDCPEWYTTPAPAPTKMLKHVGCYVDDVKDRAMAYKHKIKFLGVEACAEVCRTMGAVYMGYQWQQQCWCAKERDNVMKHGPGTGCKNGLGGPKWPLNPALFDLYEVSSPPTVDPVTVKEAWCTQEGRSPGKSLAQHTNVNTMLECQELCEAHSDCLSIVKDGEGNCFLLPRRYNKNYEHVSGTMVANRGQTKHCKKLERVGCYKDVVGNRAMSRQHWDKRVSVEQCAHNCRELGAHYSGYQWQKQCWCANENEDVMKHGESTACEANGKGGFGAFDLYVIKDAAVALAFELDGCYKDKVGDRAMPKKVYGLSAEFAPEECAARCKDNHYDHFAIQWQKQCWCGSGTELSKIKRHGSSLHCTNNRGGSGKYAAFSLYSIE